MSIYLADPACVEVGSTAVLASTVINGSLEVTGTLVVDGATILNDLQVNGTTTTLNTITTTITDPIVDIGEVGVAAAQTGIRALEPTGAAGNQQLVYETARGAWTAGVEGAEKVLAVRENTPASAHALVWDAATAQLLGESSKVDTYFVDKAGNDANDGLTGASAFLTIAAATAVAASGDTIMLSPNPYAENVVLPDGVNLRGVGATIVGTGTALDVGDGSCVRLAMVESPGVGILLNKPGGGARVFLNMVTSTGNGVAFLCTGGALDVVCSSVIVANGAAVGDLSTDRINLTASRVEITGTGLVLGAIGSGKISAQVGEVDAPAGVCFFATGGAATLSLDAARVTAATLSNITAATTATLTASSINGAFAETGAGTAALSTPSLIIAPSVDIKGDSSDTSKGLRFCSGTDKWSWFGGADFTGSGVVLRRFSGPTGVAEISAKLGEDLSGAHQPLMIGNATATLSIDGSSINLGGDTILETSSTFTASTAGITTDLIGEKTPAAGVTIDSVNCKDGAVTISAVNAIAGGTITYTADGHVFIADGTATTDAIRFQTGNGANRAWVTFGRQDATGDVVAVGHVLGSPQIVGLNQGLTAYVNLKVGNEPATLELAGSAITVDGNVTVEGVHTFTASSAGFTTDSISEKTAAAGITVDGVLLKDTTVQADSISFDSGANVLDAYETSDETLTVSGPVDTTMDVRLVKIGRSVTMHIIAPALSSFGNSTAAVIVCTAISSAFRPTGTTDIESMLPVIDAGSKVLGNSFIGTDGILNIGLGVSATAFTATGSTVNWSSSSIRWVLA